MKSDHWSIIALAMCFWLQLPPSFALADEPTRQLAVTEVAALKGESVSWLDASPDGKRLIACRSGLAIDEYDAKDLSHVRQLKARGDKAFYGHNSSLLVISGGSKIVDHNKILIIDSMQNIVKCINAFPNFAVNAHGNVLAYSGHGDDQSTIFLFNLDKMSPMATYRIESLAVPEISFVADRGDVGLHPGVRVVRVWGKPHGPESVVLRANSEVRSSNESPDGRFVALGTSVGRVELWDLDKRERIRDLEAHEAGGVRRLCFSPDGKYLMSLSDQGEIVLWNAKTYRLELRAQGHSGLASALACFPDGKNFATGGHDDGFIKLWRIIE